MSPKDLFIKIAGVLLAACIIWSGLRLRSVQDIAGRLDRLEASAVEVGAAARLDELASIAEAGPVGQHGSRWTDLARAHWRAAVYESLDVAIGEGPSLPLSVVGRRPLGAERSDATLRIVARAGSLLVNRLGVITVDGRPLGPTAGRSASLGLSEDGSPRRVVLAAAPRGALAALGAATFDLQIAVDQTPPTVVIRGADGPKPIENGRVTVLPDEPLALEVLDESVLAWTEVRRNGADVPMARGEQGNQIWTIPTDSDSDVTVDVTDAAGNTTRFSYRIALDERPPVVVESLHIDGEVVTDGTFVTRDATVAVAVMLREVRHPRDLTVRIEGADADREFVEVDSKRTATLTLPESSQGRAVRYVIRAREGQGRPFELAAVDVTLDRTAPRIFVFTSNSDPIIGDSATVLEETSLRIEVTDDVGLAPGGVKTRRAGEILIPLSQDNGTARSYVQSIEVRGAGSIVVKAQDRAGNESHREIAFTVETPVPVDDGTGPTIVLRTAGKDLDPTQELVFHGSAALELEIRDESGLDARRLDLKGGHLTSPGPTDELPTAATWKVAVEGHLVVTAVDRFGNATRREYRVTVIKGSFRITDVGGVTVGPNAAARVRGLPVPFRIEMATLPPQGRLTAALQREGKPEIPAEIEGINGRILPDERLIPGLWTLVVRLRAEDGDVDLGTTRLEFGK